MKYVFAFLQIIGGLWAAFIASTKAAGGAEERVRTNQANTERLERQDAVANKPVSDDELKKSLKDGSF